MTSVFLTARPQGSKDGYPSTTWSDNHSAFVILLPRKAGFATSIAASSFSTSFDNLFAASTENAAPKASSGALRTCPNHDKQTDNDWNDVEESSSFGDFASSRGNPVMTPSTTTISRNNTFGPPTLDRLPSVSTTPNPEILLRNATPYILQMTQRGSGRVVEQSSGRVFDQGSSRFGQGSTSTQIEPGGNTITVHGTHEPTLQFLNKYLSRWIKKDHQDTRKVGPHRLVVKARLQSRG